MLILPHADLAQADIAPADIANEPQQPRAVIRHQVTTSFTVTYSNRKLIHTVHGVATFSYDSDTMPHRRFAASQNRRRHDGARQFKKSPRRMIIPDFAHRLVRCTQYLKHAKAKRDAAPQN